MTTGTAATDPAKVEQFLGQLISIYTGSMLSYMIHIGHGTGLFTASVSTVPVPAILINSPILSPSRPRRPEGQWTRRIRACAGLP